MSTEHVGTLTVLRHGGRSNDRWRIVYQGKEADEAQRVFDFHKQTMRQGGVRLIRFYGPGEEPILREYHAPTLRTRW
jgi:hypothetical protein